jgi:hypothetical protein
MGLGISQSFRVLSENVAKKDYSLNLDAIGDSFLEYIRYLNHKNHNDGHSNREHPCQDKGVESAKAIYSSALYNILDIRPPFLKRDVCQKNV